MVQPTMVAMEMLPLFEAARRAGEAAAASCQAKAEAAGFNSVSAMAAVLDVLRKAGQPMTGEELVDACQDRGIVPHDGRAFGPVFKELARRGLIETVGFAMRRKGRGTAGARVWQIAAASR